MTVRVKICGITSSEQAQMAQQYGADALGLVIYEKSPRYVNLEQAAKIRASITNDCLAIVLLVNPSELLVKQVNGQEYIIQRTATKLTRTKQTTTHK